MEKTFTLVRADFEPNIVKNTYIANQFVLSKYNECKTEHLMGIKPAYRINDEINSRMMATVNNPGGVNTYSIGNTDNADICFHLTNLSETTLVVILSKDNRQVANIVLRPSQYYCMDNQNMKENSYFGIKRKVINATEVTISSAGLNFIGNNYTFNIIAEKTSSNTLSGAKFTAVDFITIESKNNTNRRGTVFYNKSLLSEGSSNFNNISNSLINSSTHTEEFCHGISSEKLQDVSIDLDCDHTVNFTTIICINPTIRFMKWEFMGTTTQRYIIEQFISNYIPKKFEYEKECVICLASSPNITAATCGHTCMCKQCSFSVFNCPLCRKTITARVEI